jgi:hypothetical protein
MVAMTTTKYLMYVNDEKEEAWEIILCFNKRKARVKEKKYKHERAQKFITWVIKRNHSRKKKKKFFDEKRIEIRLKKKTQTTHTNTINRLVIISYLYVLS